MSQTREDEKKSRHVICLLPSLRLIIIPHYELHFVHTLDNFCTALFLTLYAPLGE